jgi:hypothetical protein
MAVSIQQAAVNALAAHLAAQLPDVRIEDRWPDPQCRLMLPTITILMSAPRQDLAIDMRNLSLRNVGSSRVAFQTQIAACEQLLQLDVWAANQVQRDDILARLDIALNMDTLNPGEVMHGLNLAAGDNWIDTYFDYFFESPELDDAPFTAIVDEWRARYRGHAWMMLSVNRETARQAVINFKLQIQETDFVTVTIP